MKKYRDQYFLRAKQENYPARSVYKLQELDAKFHLIRPGMRILDLGAAPGSWTMWAAMRTGANGLVLACDLHSIDIELPPHVRCFKEDVFSPGEDFAAALASCGPFDLVMSDMAPATTGSRCTDQARSYNLALQAFELACLHLKQEGSFVVKIFMGPDAGDLLAQMRTVFGSVKNFKPKSSRAESKETFFTGLSYHGRMEQDSAAASPIS